METAQTGDRLPEKIRPHQAAMVRSARAGAKIRVAFYVTIVVHLRSGLEVLRSAVRLVEPVASPARVGALALPAAAAFVKTFVPPTVATEPRLAREAKTRMNKLWAALIGVTLVRMETRGPTGRQVPLPLIQTVCCRRPAK